MPTLIAAALTEMIGAQAVLLAMEDRCRETM